MGTEAQKIWRERNKDRIRENGLRIRQTEKGMEDQKNRRLFTRYRIRMKDKIKMYEEQNGNCAICGNPFPLEGRSGLGVDHNHKTKVIRGLLCMKCNVMLHVLENHDFINLAIEYLKNYETFLDS